MFRDASRIGQVAASDSTVLAEALSYFDRAAAIRLSHASLVQLAGTPLSQLAADAEKALAAQDTQALRDAALILEGVTGADSVLAKEVSGELSLAAIVIDAATYLVAPTLESKS